MDVSKRLMIFFANFPDHYETFRPKLGGRCTAGSPAAELNEAVRQ